MKRKFKAADGSIHEYGSTLGDFLRGQRMEIAQVMAGDAGDVDQAQQTLADEMAKACGMSIEQWAQVEAGTLDPEDTACAAIAAVLGQHGVQVTAEQLMGLRDADAEKEPAVEVEIEVGGGTESEMAAASAVMDSALQAAQHEASEYRGKFDSLRDEYATLKAGIEKLTAEQELAAPLVELGRVALKARRSDVLRRAELRGTVTPAFRSTVDGSSPEQLDALLAAFGLDPAADPMCSACAKERATEYRSSEVATTDDGGPVTPAPTREITRNLIADAARVYQREQEAAGKAVSYTKAESAVRRMTPAEIIALADKV